MEIIDKQDRRPLGEGRTFGMGFAFLKKVKEDTYETVQPISPCKDYLNEVVFTENTGIPSRAYGLHYKAKQDIFKDKAYLVIKLVKSKSEEQYMYSNSIENDQEMLRSNHKHMEELVRYFEETMKMKDRTEIVQVDEHQFIVKAPLNWATSTIAISMYSLLLRVGMAYKGGITPLDFLYTYNYNKADESLLKSAIPAIKAALQDSNILKQPSFPEEYARNLSWSPHNYGILSLGIR